jgi:hypothetical protein
VLTLSAGVCLCSRGEPCIYIYILYDTLFLPRCRGRAGRLSLCSRFSVLLAVRSLFVFAVAVVHLIILLHARSSFRGFKSARSRSTPSTLCIRNRAQPEIPRISFLSARCMCVLFLLLYFSHGVILGVYCGEVGLELVCERKEFMVMTSTRPGPLSPRPTPNPFRLDVSCS